MDLGSRWTRAAWVAAGVAAPVGVAGVLVALRDDMLNANVALVLVSVVGAVAVAGGRLPGMVAAVSAALAFDFFHTRPYLRLSINSGDDVQTTALLLAVGLAVGRLAAHGRESRRLADDREIEIRRIHRIASLGAGGDPAADVIMAAQVELTELLQLRACRFEALSSHRSLPRLERSGVVSLLEYGLGDEGFCLPQSGAELPVVGRGHQLGRFVLEPSAGTSVSLDQRVVAVAIADQVGAVLAAPDALHLNSTPTYDPRGIRDG